MRMLLIGLMLLTSAGLASADSASSPAIELTGPGSVVLTAQIPTCADVFAPILKVTDPDGSVGETDAFVGMVVIGAENGVITVVASDLLIGRTQVYRVKVKYSPCE